MEQADDFPAVARARRYPDVPPFPRALDAAFITANDELLRPYLQADEERAQSLLEQLLIQHVNPLCAKIIVPDLGEAREDLLQEARLRIFTKLSTLRTQAGQEPIRNFLGYVARTAHNLNNDGLREKYPRQKIRRDHLQYLLDTEPELALWSASEAAHLKLCGLKSWQQQGRNDYSSIRLRTLVDDPLLLAATINIHQFDDGILLLEIFRYVGHPVPLNELQKVYAKLRPEYADQVDLEGEEKDNALENNPNSEASALTQLEMQQALAQLWQGILMLKLADRHILLLNWPPIHLLPETGITTLREIAAALELPDEEFAALWYKLPLPDKEIAVRLGMIAREVINRRSKIREKLKRYVN